MFDFIDHLWFDTCIESNLNDDKYNYFDIIR